MRKRDGKRGGKNLMKIQNVFLALNFCKNKKINTLCFICEGKSQKKTVPFLIVVVDD
jgi:hypothetical protein